ncbi:ABC transporter substrate-binding protein [Pelodictyon phaeoclathratiforme]|jgi:branched-chain amino acid transport system substrate-binding protein|uniref:Extracellular ligand-binding receptor n=1 Tax=Pelodictyon phaeoclathratiforme (strain DSM 5477 / BU-1) TaxID=324925 RepID=B4SCM8_PELPB|nr:penicillin-binding protein activator [Pelodictyon phaeoclathratiforme]ACF44233.1 Extracellular ligand-binding receptor [Pelodictyon phaeoclathratiforme BU-1]MBV5290028.1 penicillin-binding protein activator [Pelodictyon phaeoclathratiforme]
MRKFKVLAIIIIISAYLFACGNSKKETINIGCSLPLTGEGANYGRSVKEGVDLAIEEINQSEMFDLPLKVIYEDDKMDPREGVNAINKLITADNVPIIIGPFGSSITLAVAPIANKNKVVLLGASATADNIKDAGDYIFRITPPNSKQGNDVASFCFNSLNSKKAAIIYQTNDYGTTLKTAFESEYLKLGGEVLIVEGVDLGNKDFKTQILKIKSKQVDVVFFPLHVAESGNFLKQSKELGLNVKFISCDGAMVDDLLKLAGNAAEGTYYTSLALAYGMNDSLINSFNTNFKKKYNKEPDVYAAYYYEVTYILAHALKKANGNIGQIKEILYSINGENAYNGITGLTSFDTYGEVDKSFSIYVVSNNKFSLFK